VEENVANDCLTRIRAAVYAMISYSYIYSF